MPATLTLRNIGGFVGEHVLKLSEGVNEIALSNSGGKSTIIKALLSLMSPRNPHVQPAILLNLDSDEGEIRLEMDGETYGRQFKREGSEVVDKSHKYLFNDDVFSWLVLDPFLGKLVSRVANFNDDVTDFIEAVFGLSKVRERLEARRSEEDRLTKLRTLLVERNAELAKAIEEKRVLESRLAEIEKEIEEKAPEKVGVEKSVLASIDELNKKLGIAKLTLERYTKEREAAAERIRDAEERLRSLAEAIEQFRKKHPNPASEMASIDSSIDEIREEIANKIAMLREMNMLKDIMSRISESTPVACPVCGRAVEDPESFWPPIVNRFSSVVASLASEVDTLKHKEIELLIEKRALMEKMNEVHKLEEEVAKLRKKIEQDREQLKKIEESIQSLAEEIKSLEDAVAEARRAVPKDYEERVAEVAKLLSEAEKIRAKLKSLDLYITANEDVAKELVEVEDELRRAKREREMLEQKLHELRSSVMIEFRKVVSEVLTSLGFTWFRSVTLDEVDGRFYLRVVRVLPSGREEKQSLMQLSTTERLALALALVIATYRVGVSRRYPLDKVIVLADEVMVYLDPARYGVVVSELSKCGRYVVVTRTIPSRVPGG